MLDLPTLSTFVLFALIVSTQSLVVYLRKRIVMRRAIRLMSKQFMKGAF